MGVRSVVKHLLSGDFVREILEVYEPPKRSEPWGVLDVDLDETDIIIFSAPGDLDDARVDDYHRQISDEFDKYGDDIHIVTLGGGAEAITATYSEVFRHGD